MSMSLLSVPYHYAKVKLKTICIARKVNICNKVIHTFYNSFFYIELTIFFYAITCCLLLFKKKNGTQMNRISDHLFKMSRIFTT
jgi:hypothetical protein